ELEEEEPLHGRIKDRKRERTGVEAIEAGRGQHDVLRIGNERRRRLAGGRVGGLLARAEVIAARQNARPAAQWRAGRAAAKPAVVQITELDAKVAAESLVRLDDARLDHHLAH